MGLATDRRDLREQVGSGSQNETGSTDISEHWLELGRKSLGPNRKLHDLVLSPVKQRSTVPTSLAVPTEEELWRLCFLHKTPM